MKALNQITLDEIPWVMVELHEMVGLTKAHYELCSAKLKVVYAELYNAIKDISRTTEKSRECYVLSQVEYMAQLHTIAEAQRAYHQALGNLEAYQQKYQLLYLREKNNNHTF